MPAHPHAELMALYAEDATETDEPWKLWEWFHSHSNKWLQCNKHPTWQLGNKYRRAPERQWYRVALLKTSSGEIYTFTADMTFQGPGYLETAVEGHPNFVKWLTDRVYYDVE